MAVHAFTKATKKAGGCQSQQLQQHLGLVNQGTARDILLIPVLCNDVITHLGPDAGDGCEGAASTASQGEATAVASTVAAQSTTKRKRKSSEKTAHETSRSYTRSGSVVTVASREQNKVN